MKLSRAFRQAGFFFPVSDYQFRLTCTCGVQLQLDECTTTDRGDLTLYACPRCAAPLVGIEADAGVTLPAGMPPADDAGHNMVGHIFGGMVDLELWPPAAIEPFLTIPRRPGFFSARQLV